MKPTSMNETDRLIMNQLCKVCGEPAAGYHFGAFTCEGCKSFFGRTYNNLSALGECKNNGECVINKKNRTSCKSCRLKKCLVVGMSKSGSRYGRRSNWFKIHCLIQDQQEMSNRMAEQGLTTNHSSQVNSSSLNKNGSTSSLADELKITDPKEFLAKYKENELRTSTNSLGLNHNNHHLNELTAVAAAAVAQNNPNNSHRISPRLAASPSTTNSDGSISHRSISSPFHSSGLFDSAKMAAAAAAAATHPFNNPYLPAAAAAQTAAAAAAAAAFNTTDFHKEFSNLSNLANRFNPATIPLAPISPLSPLNAAVSRLFLQNSAIFGKRMNELQKLQNEQLLSQAQRFLNPTLVNQMILNNNGNNKTQHLQSPSNKDLIEEMANGMRSEFYGDIPEQDGPIDLSVKRLADYKELSLAAMAELTKLSFGKQVPGDHDSGFSPSSNEDNHTSPLDLTSSNSTSTKSNSKRVGLTSIRMGPSKSSSNDLIKNDHPAHTDDRGDDGDDEISDVEVNPNEEDDDIDVEIKSHDDDDDEDIDVDDDDGRRKRHKSHPTSIDGNSKKQQLNSKNNHRQEIHCTP